MQLVDELRAFVAERDWAQFHSPKNLSMALCVEASELLEIFQWRSQQQSEALAPEVMEQVSQEVGDVLIYLLMLSDRLGIDPLEAAREKIALNRAKYPARKVRGKSRKYSEYGEEEAGE